ncbi:Monocarboxylate transporter-like protein 1 [Sarcoptes scabiei]|uniref:Monocarboxylate transporter-like protein 1 n=1 Tax=Sarcoptes scabiei TaxID=52283 RepID=A0A131ZT51_SARSC|nr:Monocarboxylate transporter-like protein 1 [Sarcoptes scabiei]
MQADTPVNFHNLLSQQISLNSSSTAHTSQASSSKKNSKNKNVPVYDRPPDGGWGWMVVLASFIINLIADGVSLSFGVIYVELIDYFNESKSKTAWVGSLFLSIPLITGPIASALVDRFGCRKVTIAGSILSSAGFFLGHYATTIEHLFFAFSLSGFGLALCYVTSIVSVAYWFEKRRSLATGLAVCGTGFGTFLFAPLIIFLLNEYKWRGTLLVISAIFLNMICCGFLIRDLEIESDSSSSSSSSSSSNTISDLNSSLSNSVANLDSDSGPFPKNNLDNHYSLKSPSKETDKHNGLAKQRHTTSLLSIPTFVKQGNEEHSSKENNHTTELTFRRNGYLHNLICYYPHLLAMFLPCDIQIDDLTVKTSLHNNKNNVPQAQARPSVKSSQKVVEFGSTHLFESNTKLDDIDENKIVDNSTNGDASSAPDIYRTSMATINEDKSSSFWQSFKEILFDLIDFSNFKSLRYSIFCLSNFLLYACIDVPYVYIPDQVITSGASDKEGASKYISIIGVFNTIGVVFVGYIGDKPWLDASFVYAILISISGLVMVTIPFTTQDFVIIIQTAIYGFSISANYSLVSVILVELISLDSFTTAYGMLLLVQGFGSLIGPPLAGWIYDISGKYDNAFYITGITILISGLLVIPVGRKKNCFLWKPKLEKKDSTNNCSDFDSSFPPSDFVQTIKSQSSNV